ncbi:hypothetical protein HGG76_05725 [Ochrobactrum tritici]|uniref:Uncharacterized protein n=1 Tax=Brucella tritici TaxID=94626 RepID=A0A7X6FP80_9HYPH|nr:hypothetical protein [Brucella tritici]
MPVFIDLANAFNKWYDANAKLIRQKIGEWAKRLRQIFRDLLDPTSDLRRKISEFAQGFVEAYGKIKPFVDFLGGPLKAGLGLLALWVLAPAITGVALLALALGGLGKAIAGVAFNALGLAIKGLGHLLRGLKRKLQRLAQKQAEHMAAPSARACAVFYAMFSVVSAHGPHIRQSVVCRIRYLNPAPAKNTKPILKRAGTRRRLESRHYG